MIAADRPVQRPRDATLLVVNEKGGFTHAPRARFLDFVDSSDVVIANDAATLPASLLGVHLPSGAAIEVRLAGRASLPLTRPHFFQRRLGAGDSVFEPRIARRHRHWRVDGLHWALDGNGG